MSRRWSVLAPVVGILVLLSATGCGAGRDDFASLSARRISDQSEEAMLGLRSLSLDGEATSGGSVLHLSLSADTHGTCAGSIGLGGGTADLVGVDGAEYLRGDEKFWTAAAGTQAPAVATLLGGRWAKLPPGSKEFASFCDLDTLLARVRGKSAPRRISKGGVSRIAGRDAVELTAVDAHGTTHTWVATRGRHYVLKVVQEGDEPGSMTFAGFDEPVEAEPPAAGQYVDMGAVG